MLAGSHPAPNLHLWGFHISMILTTGENFKKIHDLRVTYPGLFDMKLPNEVFFPLSNRCYDDCKNVFRPFP